MKGLVLLSALACRIYLLLPNNFYGRLVECELTRDWTVTAVGRNSSLTVYNKIKERVMKRVVVVRDSYDYNPSSLPKWGLTKLGPWHDFDKRALRVSTYPLRYVDYLLNKSDWDREHTEWVLKHSNPLKPCPVCGWGCDDEICWPEALREAPMCPEPKCPLPPWTKDLIRGSWRRWLQREALHTKRAKG